MLESNLVGRQDIAKPADLTIQILQMLASDGMKLKN